MEVNWYYDLFLVAFNCTYLNQIYIFTDDIEWNMDNIKLGLFEGQTFDNFDIRFEDALKNENESDDNNNSFIASQDINQSVNESDLNKENK